MAQAIELGRAYLCCDCNVIGDDPRRCTRCLSTALLPLARVLEGPTEHGQVTRIRQAVGEVEV